MAANLLRHERFERAPMALPKRRRGPLPEGVVSIKSASRLKVGALVEMIGTNNAANVGIRACVIKFDASSRWCWAVKSLNRPIACNDGALSTDSVWCKDRELRRVWTGLSTNERIQLRIRRAS